MGFFGKSDIENNSDLNAFLGAGTEYRGKLDFVGTVRIDGRFEGEILTGGCLILGRDAVVVGDIQVGRLTSNGRIEGEVVVKKHATLEKTACLKGSLTTPKLVVQDGAVIEGGIMMTKDEPDGRNNVVAADFGQKTAAVAIAPGASVGKTGSDDVN